MINTQQFTTELSGADVSIISMDTDRDLQGTFTIKWALSFEFKEWGIKSIMPSVQEVTGIIEDFEDKDFLLENFSDYDISCELEGLEPIQDIYVNINNKTIEVL